MKKKKGRPKNYCEIIEGLSDFQCYSPASIAYFGLRHQLVKKPTPHTADKTMILRIRTTLARFAAVYMPESGDGHVRVSGQGVGPGWFGWRWKQAYLQEICPQVPPSSAGCEMPHTGSQDHGLRPAEGLSFHFNE